MQAGGAGDALRRALAALGAMLGGAAFGRVDDAAGEQRLARPGEVRRLGEAGEGVEDGAAEMGLGEIEGDPGFLAARRDKTSPDEATTLIRERRRWTVTISPVQETVPAWS